MAAPRIIAGVLRGRVLATPEGLATRPSSARVRQALFDILAHARWAEHAIVGRTVLDVFAGSGALGLEALSRGAARATFIEADRAACVAIRRNIDACRVGDQADLVAADALAPPRAAMPHDLVLLDPPYGAGLIPRALDALGKAGWIAPDALIAAEFGRADPIPNDIAILAERIHGPARLAIWRMG
ncbi:16S rRNA (guanine(966)-N(2))-methyltransferase RsmD [Acidiphilium sp. AL]|uniref:16S rRNA (Guanine(966)-N(2))-methyltransferase RsmD n=1 Tax=Acidiphilium iwatense TaxID=768198 RepID=A0ABS9E1P8_9PROT|nr:MULTISPECIES: 16S rRNA (guanine(966)-N(2))-methyltransferase RsmD [Acidiphilium]MCF3947504.1 16S rRNA (guanine(966)-N(2))-methyltransferase RsmD [Acidiphilium iwatense]MCU4158557.1 16S rRNA (guanine(966)-N(2))-methyltransferase RsmD [Acidiphilium sp. AL]